MAKVKLAGKKDVSKHGEIRKWLNDYNNKTFALASALSANSLTISAR